ncbi:MAG: thiamine-phosphate kinase [Xanthobacter sp. 17-67-6]|nr:MAG: thiamine-phosphate kinase [Xanthobacter sp. 17-67-6]
MTASGEDRFIARFFRPLATSAAALNLLDDTALLPAPAAADLVLTKDALVAGVHFFADDPPASIGRKALGVNLSDLAAKGAAPLGALLALALPPDTGEAWVEAFAAGLGEDMDRYGCPLLGGDTVHTPGPLTISLTAIGAVPKGRFVPRTGAAPGQAILVSGTIGDAALGLKLRLEPGRAGFATLPLAHREHLRHRYLVPQPRLALAEALRTHAASAMDISDGLVGDIAKMLAVSGCGGWIESAAVPLSNAAAAVIAAEGGLLATALTGGDDYEVACTVPLDQTEAAIALAAQCGVALHLIGETRAEPGLDVIGDGGMPLHFARSSYSHI